MRVHSQKPTKKRRKRRRKYYYECQAVAPSYRQLRICRAAVIGKPVKTVVLPSFYIQNLLNEKKKKKKILLRMPGSRAAVIGKPGKTVVLLLSKLGN